MRRHALHAASSLTAGALITLLIAFAAGALRLRPSDHRHQPADEPTLLVRETRYLGATLTWVQEHQLSWSFGRGERVIGPGLPEWARTFSDDWFNRVGILPICRLEAGWPWRCLAAEAAPGPSAALSWNGAFIARHPWRPDRSLVVPRRATPGLLADVGFWTAAWLAIGSLRPLSRRFRGRCTRCGYRLYEVAGCPECGRGMPPADEPVTIDPVRELQCP